MDFLKKHYEKIILAVVLIGMIAALIFIPLKISNERQALADKLSQLIPHKVPPITNLDLTLPEANLKRISTPATLELSANHRLFNPRAWQKTASGQLIPFDDSHIGPKAVTITKLTPLYMTITLDNVTTTADSVPKYIIGIQKEASPKLADRGKKETGVKLNDKNDTFTLRKIEGPPENPTKLILELTDSGDTVTITKDQPYRRIDGYMADLKYTPENLTWTSKRVGSPALHINGEDYNIVAISQTEVVLSAKSNQKKWPIPFNANSTPTNNPSASNLILSMRRTAPS